MLLASRLPLKISYKIASFIALLQYDLCLSDRRAVFSNLRVILNTQDGNLITQIAKAVFINFAKYLVDFFRFPIVNQDYIAKFINVEGKEYVDEAFKQGKGVIALTAHVGNWELAGIVTALLGYPVNAVALSHRDKCVNRLFIAQRENKGVKVIPLGAALRKCFTALRSNELIGLVGDRDFTHGGVVVEFLGRPVRVPKGPAMFALKTGAAIIPSFTIRQRDDSYRMIYRRPLEYAVTDNMEEDLKTVTKKCISAIEDVIRQYPEQWFMFREFWAEDANKV
jgi:KDO2-lipid IV(A) lauroyltransferase